MAQGEDSFEERSEQATTQRREDFRKSGQVAQSREVGSILTLLGVTILFYFLAKRFLIEVYSLFTESFTEQFLIAARQGDIIPALKTAGVKGFYLVAPVFGITLVMGVGASVLQIGFFASWDKIGMDLERINPLSGFMKIFNMRSLVEGAKSVVKIIIVGTVAYLILKKEIVFTPNVAQLSVSQIMTYTGHVLFNLMLGVCTLMALLAVLDYAFQWWDLEQRMKMTKQEVKEEHKQREGDPLIKSRIKRIQRELAQKRMMESVPKADVIITNPTHIAIAIQYDRSSMAAPVMVAKGADLIAEKIKSIARKNNIPVVENKPLARTLFKTLKIGQAIPRSLYNAVAEVLAYVYKIKGRLQQVAQEITNELPRAGV